VQHLVVTVAGGETSKVFRKRVSARLSRQAMRIWQDGGWVPKGQSAPQKAAGASRLGVIIAASGGM